MTMLVRPHTSFGRVVSLIISAILGALLASACASKFYSPTAPSGAQLPCSGGETPIAKRFYEGRFEWVCGRTPCPAEEEAIWKPKQGTEDRHGVSQADFTCASHCDTDDPRRADGTCPGLHFLHSRVDENTLVVTAVVIPPGSRGSPVNFQPSSSKETYLRMKGVIITLNDDRVQRPSQTTDSNGEVRFDIASEPFRHLVKTGDLIDFEATAQFKDGSTAKSTAVSTWNSKLAKETRENRLAQAKETATAARTKHEAECQQANGPSCLKVAESYESTASSSKGAERQKNEATSIEYYRKACALHVESACRFIDRLDHPPSTAEICAQASGCTEKCPAHACIAGCVQKQRLCEHSRPVQFCANFGTQCTNQCGGGACLQDCFKLEAACTKGGGHF